MCSALFIAYNEGLYPTQGRASSNLEFQGNKVFNQQFFIESFPGIYEGVWKRMTEGAQRLLISCDCVFFQDTAGGVNGRHDKPCCTIPPPHP